MESSWVTTGLLVAAFFAFVLTTAIRRNDWLRAMLGLGPAKPATRRVSPWWGYPSAAFAGVLGLVDLVRAVDQGSIQFGILGGIFLAWAVWVVYLIRREIPQPLPDPHGSRDTA